MEPAKKIMSPGELFKSLHKERGRNPDDEQLRAAREIAVRILEELKVMPGMAPGATQYPKLATAPGDDLSREVLTLAADMLGHAGWLDVRIELGKTAPPILLVQVVVPREVK